MSTSPELSVPIHLAHEAVFEVGSLSVLPATRELRRADGASEIIEPRVMQVLVALCRAGGQVVSRHDLTQSCWDGTVVGDDAINRVMSRLRRVAEGLGEGSFRIETVTKVGYRLLASGGSTGVGGGDPGPPAAAAPVKPRLDRRTMLIGAGALGASATAVGTWRALSRWWSGSAPVSSEATALMSQGLIASHSGTSEGLEQAIGFFRRATELEPNNADAWGALAMAHALSSFVAEPTDERAARARARNALERSLQIDPTNPYAAIAMAHSLPRRSHWLERDRLLTAALKRQPDSDGLKGTLSNFWASVGRVREAAEIQDALDFNKAPAPLPLYSRALVLWSANRLEEADRAIEQAYQLYPLHYAVWFSRFYLLLFNGRASQAIAMAEDAGKRPLGIPATNFDDILQVARALHDREPWRIQRVVDRQLDLAHTGCGLAENAVTFVAALGRLDTAFDILGAYYFARGFVVPEIRFPAQQRFRTRMADRFTAFLFMPPLAQLRRDPRFDRLAGELGLKEYWSRSGHPMDAHLR